MDSVTKEKTHMNFSRFLWHAVFLALASHMMDVDTILPAMVLRMGGNALHVGILTAIALGGMRVFQLVFAGFMAPYPRKKAFLLAGINLRVVALAGLAVLFFGAGRVPGALFIPCVFLIYALFSVSGAFANVAPVAGLPIMFVAVSAALVFTLPVIKNLQCRLAEQAYNKEELQT